MNDKAVDCESLIQQALQGDQHAYAELLSETVRFLRPFLAKRLGTPSDADDLMQEILISIHKARHTYDGNRPYRPWAYAIALYRLQDYLRAWYADPLRQAVELADVENYLFAPVTKTGFSYESILGEVRKLPRPQAAILKLMHQDGYTAKEVAAKTGMNLSAVKVAAFRAYKILRSHLERE